MELCNLKWYVTTKECLQMTTSYNMSMLVGGFVSRRESWQMFQCEIANQFAGVNHRAIIPVNCSQSRPQDGRFTIRPGNSTLLNPLRLSDAYMRQ